MADHLAVETGGDTADVMLPGSVRPEDDTRIAAPDVHHLPEQRLVRQP